SKVLLNELPFPREEAFNISHHKGLHYSLHLHKHLALILIINHRLIIHLTLINRHLINHHQPLLESHYTKQLSLHSLQNTSTFVVNFHLQQKKHLLNKG
ncbi:MAG: hypothetical protein LBU27_05155, partial [Candidatus Peribacteria bacterium]|nr:hypothetical protein [Candidatus Peribacteria bacterium]